MTTGLSDTVNAFELKAKELGGRFAERYASFDPDAVYRYSMGALGIASLSRVYGLGSHGVISTMRSVAAEAAVDPNSPESFQLAQALLGDEELSAAIIEADTELSKMNGDN